MRSLSGICSSLLAGLVCVAATSCDQRPIDVFPESNLGTWRTLQALQSAGYNDLDGKSSTDIYGAASPSGLIHYDGTGWSEVGSPGEYGLDALSVVSAGEIYAVGFRKAYRFDGAAWHEFYDFGNYGFFWDVWTLDGSSVFAAGFGGVLRFDESLALVDSVYTGQLMTGIWGSSYSDVFVIGRYDSVLHFDGTDWASVSVGAGGRFEDIHGVGPDEVYAVGTGLFLKYDGTGWSPIGLPEGIGSVSAVWAAAADDVYLFHGPGGIAHYDGSGFQVMNSTTDQYIRAAWGASPDDIVAVGENEKVIRFDGSGWASVSGGLPSRASFLWGIDSQHIYIVNYSTVFRYDGSSVEELPRADDQTPISALWGTSPDNLVSVGRGGGIFHFDGSNWTRAAGGTSVDLHAVTGSGANSMFAVGNDGTVLRYDGSRWVVLREQPGSGVAYRDAWSAGGLLYVVGDGGTASRFNGAVWEALNTGEDLDLLSVWGTAADNVYAAGEGAVFRFDGSGWRREVLQPCTSCVSFYDYLTGNGPNDAWVLSDRVWLYHFNGEMWSPAGAALRDRLAGLWLDKNDKVYGITSYADRLDVFER
jgi:hypothetical protein